MIALLAGCSLAAASAEDLRICADPNNLPFSNRNREGFENRIIELLARDMGMTPRCVWWAQRRGNLRNTLNARLCDVVPGIASGVEMAATTRPYYRSTYVFVMKAGRGAPLASFDDPRLEQWLIGVQMIGDDGANTPPAHALSRRGHTGNVRGYPIYGNYANPNPPAAIIDAVARGDIDVAVAWGPMAGYFAAHSPVPLEVRPVQPWLDGPQWPIGVCSSGVWPSIKQPQADRIYAIDHRRSVDRRSQFIGHVAGALAVTERRDSCQTAIRTHWVACH
ncbi:quinoprotein dehydrogenase-associated putative ABC transporter substrate-binding protein [Dyella sp. 2RAB6]|uniref:quinoprotein dehydrogenase-associated putative ABC transporter substrate-binding protein n=1 Tax=Dyella sp. 2RAB6 TaxID=3232992 RepID=UPI003F930E62